MSYSATLRPAEAGFRPAFKLSDDTTLSVQTGKTAYCTPRDGEGPWTHVEVGAWTDVPAFRPWLEQLDESSTASGSHLRVYPYLPVEILDREIERRGGVA